MLVLDASAALALALGDGDESFVRALSRGLVSRRALVPQHWPLEINNGLLMAIRRGRLPLEDGRRAQQLLLELTVRVDEGTAQASWSTAFELAHQTGLTVYDAAYLELAIRADAALATADRELATAGLAYGLEVL